MPAFTNTRPEGQHPAFARSEDMVVNQEINAILSEHFAVPRWPDGACFCGATNIHGQVAHLIEVLQSKLGGTMPTFTEEPDTVDTVTPFATDEVAELQEETTYGPFRFAAPLTDYDVRMDALNFARDLQDHVDEYATADSLIADAQVIYEWLNKAWTE